MTQEEIIEMARQADGHVTMWVNHSTIQKTTTFTFESPIDYRVSGDYPEMYHIKFLGRFANLVAAKEREACAMLCENMAIEWEDQPQFARVEIATMMDCALAIRNKGEQA